jgi:hypothetical protein
VRESEQSSVAQEIAPRIAFVYFLANGDQDPGNQLWKRIEKVVTKAELEPSLIRKIESIPYNKFVVAIAMMAPLVKKIKYGYISKIVVFSAQASVS